MSVKKLVAITGASSGIGEATAKLLSAKGHPLLLMARRVDRMEALKLPNTLCKQVDVTDSKGLVAAVQEAEKQFAQPVDCLVNNAGVMLLGKIGEQDPAEWDKMFDVNLKGLMYAINAVLPAMKQRKEGTIINISSVAGRKTFPNHVAYCGSKFGVHAISENLREEVSQDNVRVITIAPGATETELLSHTTDQAIKTGYEDWKKDMGGVLAADDIAEAIAYAYGAPQRACVREIVLCATKQAP